MKIYKLILCMLVSITVIAAIVLLITQWFNLHTIQKFLVIDYIIGGLIAIAFEIYNYLWKRSMHKLMKDFYKSTKGEQ